MKIETKETKLDTMEDAFAIAKRWYTEQRGRRPGNTVAWDDLSDKQRLRITTHVVETLVVFYNVMRPEPTPHEKRDNENPLERQAAE